MALSLTQEGAADRKVFDILASARGAVMAVVLVVAGALLLWGASFANGTRRRS